MRTKQETAAAEPTPADELPRSKQGWGVLMRPGNSLGFLVTQVSHSAPSGGVALRVRIGSGTAEPQELVLDGEAVRRIVEVHRVACCFGCQSCEPEAEG